MSEPDRPHHDPSSSPVSVPPDPIARRITSCTIWLVAYGLVWGLGVWRPLPQVAWVNFVIIGGILLGTLPPASVRPFCAAIALLGVAAAMYFGIHNQLFAILLVVLGLLALSDGVFRFSGRG